MVALEAAKGGGWMTMCSADGSGGCASSCVVKEEEL